MPGTPKPAPLTISELLASNAESYTQFCHRIGITRAEALRHAAALDSGTKAPMIEALIASLLTHRSTTNEPETY